MGCTKFTGRLGPLAAASVAGVVVSLGVSAPATADAGDAGSSASADHPARERTGRQGVHRENGTAPDRTVRRPGPAASARERRDRPPQTGSNVMQPRVSVAPPAADPRAARTLPTRSETVPAPDRAPSAVAASAPPPAIPDVRTAAPAVIPAPAPTAVIPRTAAVGSMAGLLPTGGGAPGTDLGSGLTTGAKKSR